MGKRQQNKLRNYFRNSYQFMWRLGRGNKAKTYGWLHSQGIGFITDKYTYDQTKRALLDELGIEKIINELIIPRVKELFSDSKLKFLRDCWKDGHLPNIATLKQHGIRTEDNLFYMYQEAYPFLEIRTANRQPYVERWGEFAGLWFEEIEPLLGRDDA